jgi:uncharacterized protein (DUF1499 family)
MQKRRFGSWFARAVAANALTLALLCLALELLAGYGYQREWWQLDDALKLLRSGTWGAIAAALLAVADLAVFVQTRRAVFMAAAALVVSAVAIGVPGYHWYVARQSPPIHDITTDTANPPRFVDVVPRRDRARNPVDYGGAPIAALQKQHYPDIAPLLLDLPPPKAFAKALEAARAMGWEIVAERPAELRIEATASTRLFGFRDDVVIRIAAEGGGSRVDVRSKSRIGRGDLGTNARRVRAYLAELRGRA